jgi:hypothetical protein
MSFRARYERGSLSFMLWNLCRLAHHVLCFSGPPVSFFSCNYLIHTYFVLSCQIFV